MPDEPLPGPRVEGTHVAADGTRTTVTAAVTQTAKGVSLDDMRMADGTPMVLLPNEAVEFNIMSEEP